MLVYYRRNNMAGMLDVDSPESLLEQLIEFLEEGEVTIVKIDPEGSILNLNKEK